MREYKASIPYLSVCNVTATGYIRTNKLSMCPRDTHIYIKTNILHAVWIRMQYFAVEFGLCMSSTRTMLFSGTQHTYYIT